MGLGSAVVPSARTASAPLDDAVRRNATETGWTPPAADDLDVARVRRWCAQRVPLEALHQVRVECEIGPGRLTAVEPRAPRSGSVSRH